MKVLESSHRETALVEEPMCKLIVEIMKCIEVKARNLMLIPFKVTIIQAIKVTKL